MLTVDPSQKKVVAILMVILIGAVCVTVVRVMPHSAGGRTKQAVSAAAGQAPRAKRVEVQVKDLSRNPFKAPQDFLDAKSVNDTAEMNAGGAGTAPADGTQPGQKTIGSLPVPPMDISGPMKAAMAASPQGDKDTMPKQPKPTFALLATIQSAGGLSAVIKSGDSDVRVVSVGDKLESGYKVKRLEPDRAVLTDGRDTIVAKKPQI